MYDTRELVVRAGTFVGGLGVGAALAYYLPLYAVALVSLILAFLSLYGILLLAEKAVHIHGIHTKNKLETGALQIAAPSTQSRVDTLPPARIPETRATAKQARPVASAPTFRELLGANAEWPFSSFVLGWASGEPVLVDKPLTMGIAGLTSGGKTTTTLWVMLQLILLTDGDVRFIVHDPHGESKTGEELVSKAQALQPFFLTRAEIYQTLESSDGQYRAALADAPPTPTTSEQDLLAWVTLVDLELKRRKKGKTGPLWVVIIDEFTSVMESPIAGRVAGMLERISQQARKYNLLGVLIGQNWKGTRTGGTELRNSIPWFFVHRMPKQVSELILPSDVAKLTPNLNVGQAVVYTTTGEANVLTVPLVTQADAEHVAFLYAGTTVQELPTPALPPPSVVREIADPLTQYDETELEQVKRLYADGHSEQDIAKIVYGVKGGAELALRRGQVKRMLQGLVLR